MASPVTNNLKSFVSIYRERIHLAHQIQKINRLAPHLSIVRYDTPELKEKLKEQICVWIQDLNAFKKSWGVNNAYVEHLFQPTQDGKDIDLIIDSQNILTTLLGSLTEGNRKLIVVEDLGHAIQGVIELDENFELVHYLATAPSNLPIQLNVRSVRGVGTKLLREAMRLNLIYGNQSLSLLPFSNRCRGFYSNLRFVSSGKRRSFEWVEINLEGMASQKHLTKKIRAPAS